MLQKNLLILFLFLVGCGYTPMYSNLSKTNINIDIIEVKGDVKINNTIIQKLEKYKTVNAQDNYTVKINSIYKKTPLIKDKAGNTTDYRLKLEVVFLIDINENSQKIIIEEKFDMKKGETNFQEEKYEDILVDDMINIIIQKFISQL